MLARTLGGIDDIDAPQEHIAPRPIAVRAAAGPEPTGGPVVVEPRRTVRRTLHETSGSDGTTSNLDTPLRRGDGRDVARASLLPAELKALAGLSGGAEPLSAGLTTARRRRQAELDSTGMVAPAEPPRTTGSQLVPPWGDSSTGEDPDRTECRRQPFQRPLPAQTGDSDLALGHGARRCHSSRERRLWDLQTWSGNAANAISLSRGEPPRSQAATDTFEVGQAKD